MQPHILRSEPSAAIFQQDNHYHSMTQTSCGVKAQQTPFPCCASRHRAVSRNSPKIESHRPTVTPHLPWKFHANRSSHFLAMLLFKQRNKDRKIHTYIHTYIQRIRSKTIRKQWNGVISTAEYSNSRDVINQKTVHQIAVWFWSHAKYYFWFLFSSLQYIGLNSSGPVFIKSGPPSFVMPPRHLWW